MTESRYTKGMSSRVAIPISTDVTASVILADAEMVVLMLMPTKCGSGTILTYAEWHDFKAGKRLKARERQ